MMTMRRGVAALAAMAAIAHVAVGAAAPPPAAAGHVPVDKDERGLWMIMAEEERSLQTSPFLIRDPALGDYVRQVLCKAVGPQCADVRIYIVRTPYFNASMAPNGMMVVYSGLFLRTRDEAQLAAVLGHEFTHYQARHSLRLFRDVKAKTNALGWLSIIPVAGWVAAGAVTAAGIGVIGSIGAFSREMEREADSGSIGLLVQGGYDPLAASQIWAQIRAEQDATALARGTKSRKDKNGGLLASHPPTDERMTDLAALAASRATPAATARNREAYRAALGPHWLSFIEDQIKLNDFGASEMLLASLAEDGWTSSLLFMRGELYRGRGQPGDLVKAAGFFRDAIAAGAAPPEAWRGLGLALIRSGAASDGKAALNTYLEKRADAPDRAMIAMLAGGQ